MKRLTLCAFLLAPGAVPLSAQGPVAPPPGPPSPTFKTLQQVEPRIDLQATPAPPGVDTTNPNFHMVINQPGSYYLSANLDVTKTGGIQIFAEAVTLDLNGFGISRASGTGGTGIELVVAAHRAMVRNGSIKLFARGVNSLPFAGTYAHGCAFRDLIISGCTEYGIFAGLGALLESCRAIANSGSAGIFANGGSTLIACIASNNATTNGLFAEAGSMFVNCRAVSNTSSAAISAGIATASGCSLSNCHSIGNLSTAAPLSSSTGVGFLIGGQTTIQNCSATSNSGDGIRVSGDRCQVNGNLCAENAPGGAGAGIRLATGVNGCRVDGNHSTGSPRGFHIEGTDNLIVRNSAQGSTVANYDIAAGNHDAARATSPGAAFASTSPWANFSF